MAVLEMQRMTLCGLRKNRKAALELLQRRGVVELTDELTPDEIFNRTDTSVQCATFDKNARAAQNALDILNQYAPVKSSLLSMLEEKPRRTESEYYDFYAASAKVMDIAYDLVQDERIIAEKNGELIGLEARITALEPWLGLDIPMKYNDTVSTAALVGYLPQVLTLEAFYETLAQADANHPPVHAEVVGALHNSTCLFLLCHKDDKKNLEATLRTMGFSYPAGDCTGLPRQAMEELEARIARTEKEIEETIEDIRNYAPAREELAFAVDYFGMRREKYAVLGRLCQSRHTFVLTGFVPKRAGPALVRELSERFEAYTVCEDLGPEETAPVLLQNNAFSAPVEGVLEGYSLPGRGELDPTSVMSIFYYILFGMMFSDAGYGLLMTLATGIILLVKKNTPMKKSLQMFFWCGVSTVFWGLMLGSFFGDAIEVIGTTFFNNPNVSTPCLWFAPLNDPMRMLIYTMAIGLFHLFVGLVMGIVTKFKQKDYFSAFADYFIWILLIGSLVLILVPTPLFYSIAQMEIILPGWLGTAATVTAVFSAVFVVVFSGRESRNPFKRLAKGLYGLYGVTGYLGDVLSYSRLLALGLATGIVGTVVNQMGSMFGSGVLGAVIFIAVFLVGHALNFAINVLGAYVHTNRLQYVEFFGKFYEGGGQKFNPFKIQNKYYHIKEDQQ